MKSSFVSLLRARRSVSDANAHTAAVADGWGGSAPAVLEPSLFVDALEAQTEEIHPPRRQCSAPCICECASMPARFRFRLQASTALLNNPQLLKAARAPPAKVARAAHKLETAHAVLLAAMSGRESNMRQDERA